MLFFVSSAFQWVALYTARLSGILDQHKSCLPVSERKLTLVNSNCLSLCILFPNRGWEGFFLALWDCFSAPHPRKNPASLLPRHCPVRFCAFDCSPTYLNWRLNRCAHSFYPTLVTVLTHSKVTLPSVSVFPIFPVNSTFTRFLPWAPAPLVIS